MKKSLVIVLALFLGLIVLVACGSPETVEVQVTVEVTREVMVEGAATGGDAEAVTFEGGGDTLGTVRDRGILRCGGNQALPGFGYLDPDTGNITGFDVDYCRAIAAAVLGDADAMELIPTTGTSRFPTLQSGEIDALVRNTTWTTSRDTELGFDFAPITFFDGQGMMVRKDSGVTSLADLAGGTICVQAGTTTEKNLADVYRGMGVNIESQVYPDADSTRDAYDSGACDGFTTDKSGLVASQILLSDPDAHTILDETMSKEPLGPLTRHGDNNWGDIVSWVVFCTFAAEEYGMTSDNVDSMLGGDDPVIQNILGEAGSYYTALGLDADWCYQVIKQVGNYEEIYNRHLGPDTPFNLPRGLNTQYTDGGLLYAMPFR